MKRFWGSLRGRGTAAGSVLPLTHLLAHYPPNTPRHPGDAAHHNASQRNEALSEFLDRREERLTILRSFMTGQGVDIAPMLDPEADGARPARMVDDWLNATLPGREMSPVSGDPAPNSGWYAFRDSDRTGKEIYYSLLADLALLEGEAIRRRDARFTWAINDLRNFRDMASFGRICLIKPAQPGWEATVLDVEAQLLAICHSKMAPKGYESGHAFGELLDAAVSGAFDPPRI